MKGSLNSKKDDGRFLFWQNHVDSWKVSEYSQAVYCRQNRLALSTFQLWKRKLSSKSQRFVEVTVKNDASIHGKSAPNIKLHFGAEFTLEIPPGFNADSLKNLVATLRDL